MKVEYRTTFPDVVRFIWLHLTRSLVHLVLIGGMSAFIAWNACRGAVMQHGRIIGVIAMLLSAAMVFAALFLVGLTASILTSLSRRNKTFMTDNTLELLEDKFLTENRYGKGEYKWDIVQKVIKTRRHIVLYVTQSTGIVVPRRAFLRTEEWEAFCGFVIAHSKG